MEAGGSDAGHCLFCCCVSSGCRARAQVCSVAGEEGTTLRELKKIFLMSIFSFQAYSVVKGSLWGGTGLHWSSSVLLLWKEELLPTALWAPSEGPSPFRSPSMGSRCWCLGPKVGTALLCLWATGASSWGCFSMWPGPQRCCPCSGICRGVCALGSRATKPPSPATAGAWSGCSALVPSVCVFTSWNQSINRYLCLPWLLCSSTSKCH